MRSINNLDWHVGQAGVSLKSISLNTTLLVKLAKPVLKGLLFVPYQINRYLDSLDVAPNPYRKHVTESRDSVKYDRHQHIPSRVWQRRSELITAIEEQQEAARQMAEAQVNIAPICQVQSTVEKANCSSCSFNVVQVRCLPVWASNFSDMGIIEQELNFYSQPELINRVI